MYLTTNRSRKLNGDGAAKKGLATMTMKRCRCICYAHVLLCETISSTIRSTRYNLVSLLNFVVDIRRIELLAKPRSEAKRRVRMNNNQISTRTSYSETAQAGNRGNEEKRGAINEDAELLTCSMRLVWSSNEISFVEKLAWEV